MAMIRKQIYVTKDIDRQIKAEAKRRGVPEAAVIRERLEEGRISVSVTMPSEEAVQRLLRRIEETTARAKGKPGRRHGIKREDLYAERTRVRDPR